MSDNLCERYTVDITSEQEEYRTSRQDALSNFPGFPHYAMRLGDQNYPEEPELT